MDTKEQKIKVLRIIARLNVGGPAVHSAILTKALNDGRFKSVLVTGRVAGGEKEMGAVIKKYGISPVYINQMGREIGFINDFLSIVRIFREIKRFKPHIVHTHTSKAGFLGRIAAILSGVPVKVHTFHGHTFYGYFGKIKTMVFVNIERALALFTDKIIVISKRQMDDIVNVFKITGHKKCSVVPLGLDLGRYLAIKGDSQAGEGFGSPKEIVIGTAGRITGIKNHSFFIEIAKAVSDRCKDVKIKFVLAGDGELRGEIEDYADRLGIKDSIEMLGWQDDPVKFYESIDIFILTSKNEGTPVSIIEAMASAKPVVSTAVGGVLDLINEGITGYAVNDFNIKEFVDKLRDLIYNNTLRMTLGANARSFVRQRFTSERLVEDIKSIYLDLLKYKGVKI